MTEATEPEATETEATETDTAEPETPEPETASASDAPSKALLGSLVALGVASALWAFFLWWQLLRSRSGFEPVCIGSGACADLWNAAFASAIHRFTGLPVAAWGAVWGAVAAFLPMQALGDERGDESPWLQATRWAGLAGLAGVVVLLAVSAAEGALCGSCVVTYALSAVYGLLTLLALRSVAWSQRGLVAAAVAGLVAWGLFLYPGVRTPKNVFQESRQAFDEAAGASTDGPARVQEPVHTQTSVVPDDNPLKVTTWPLDDAERTRRLSERLAAAPPPWLGALSGFIEKYRTTDPASPLPEPRHLKGAPDADVRLTLFTDTECGHCAQLHAALTVMEQLFPEGTFHVDSRHFPLDGACNPHLQPNPDRASCAAARARVCLEDHPSMWQLETELYARQQDLSEAVIFEVLGPHVDADALRACMASPETESAIREDVEFAMVYDPHGTPLVLVNGRPWTQDPMMIYLAILAEGDFDRPVFAGLPPPPPESEHHHH